MNNGRRKSIRDLMTKLDAAAAIIDEVREALETVKAEEEDYRDAMPEGFQQGEKGQKADTAIDALENALETLGDLSFDDLASHLEEACS